MYMILKKRRKNAETIYALGGLACRAGTYNPLVSWTTHSRLTYMSAGMLGVRIHFITVRWIAHSGPTNMSAGTLGVHIHFIAVGWTTHSRPTYMSAGMLGVCIYYAPIGWIACSRPTYWLACLEYTYILSLLVGP